RQGHGGVTGRLDRPGGNIVPLGTGPLIQRTTICLDDEFPKGDLRATKRAAFWRAMPPTAAAGGCQARSGRAARPRGWRTPAAGPEVETPPETGPPVVKCVRL